MSHFLLEAHTVHDSENYQWLHRTFRFFLDTQASLTYVCIALEGEETWPRIEIKNDDGENWWGCVPKHIFEASRGTLIVFPRFGLHHSFWSTSSAHAQHERFVASDLWIYVVGTNFIGVRWQTLDAHASINHRESDLNLVRDVTLSRIHTTGKGTNLMKKRVWS